MKYNVDVDALVTLYIYYSDPPNITTSHSQRLTTSEGEKASLTCEATGKPAPNINWTRNGVIVRTGSVYNTSVLMYSDNNACYTCVAYNGIGDSKNATFCLNVHCK